MLNVHVPLVEYVKLQRRYIHARNMSYNMLSAKIAESETLFLVHDLCGTGGSIYNKETIQNILSSPPLALIQPLVVLKLMKPQIIQQHPARICFMTPDWHITHDLNLLSLKMGGLANSSVSSNKCVCKTIMASKPNQL
jgi:hypothetical protein